MNKNFFENQNNESKEGNKMSKAIKMENRIKDQRTIIENTNELASNHSDVPLYRVRPANLEMIRCLCPELGTMLDKMYGGRIPDHFKPIRCVNNGRIYFKVTADEFYPDYIFNLSEDEKIKEIRKITAAITTAITKSCEYGVPVKSKKIPAIDGLTFKWVTEENLNVFRTVLRFMWKYKVPTYEALCKRTHVYEYECDKNVSAKKNELKRLSTEISAAKKELKKLNSIKRKANKLSIAVDDFNKKIEMLQKDLNNNQDVAIQ